jgi:hypothetical protein
MVRYLAQVILERDAAGELRVAADASGLRTPPAV